MRLLYAEDEEDLNKVVTKKLTEEGFSVDSCFDGREAIDNVQFTEYDAAILDIMMPHADGFAVLKELRKLKKNTPVLFLTARDSIEDRVTGLDSGANDYLCKPFHFEELEARVRSLTRRRTVQNNVILSCGELSLDTKSRTVMAKGEKLSLTRKELGVLEYLLLHQERPVPQEELIQHVWDSSVDSFSNSIRVHISALRKKLRATLGYDPITNRIGQGYVIGGQQDE